MTDTQTRLRQQLQQLKARHERGDLDAPAYAAAKTPLERELLDQMLATPLPDAGPTTPRPSMRMVSLLSAAVLALASAGYLWTGSPGMPSAGAPGMAAAGSGGGGGGDDASHTDNEAEFIVAVEKLAERMKAEPDNLEGWAMLARSYARLGRHADALPAFEKAVALKGDDPRLLSDLADTLAVQNGRDLAGRPTDLVLRALKIDPDNGKALALAGTAAFNANDYAGAVRHWEHLAKISPADSGFMQQLQGSITEARKRAGLPADAPAAGAVMSQAAAPVAASPAAKPVAAADGAVLRGSVRLAPALAKQAAPTDTVFIFARAAEGSRMPLAILRHQVKDLPLDFQLDDSSAMTPASRLSAFPKVIVSVRISKSGQATPSAGDLMGESGPVANTASGVRIEIAEVVKN